MFVYENFDFNDLNVDLQNRLLQTNFVVSDILYDEQKLLKDCKIVSDLHIGMMTVSHSFVEHIWKWVEKANINICAFIDCDLFFEEAAFNFANMFSAIRNSFQNGANFIDIKMSDKVDMNEVLKIVFNAVNGKNHLIKISVGESENILQKTGLINQLYNQKIVNFKTDNFNHTSDSGFKTKISDVNFILDFVKKLKSLKDCKIDVVANVFDENNFLFYDSVKMLCSSVFEDENFFTRNIVFSANISGLHKILQ